MLVIVNWGERRFSSVYPYCSLVMQLVRKHSSNPVKYIGRTDKSQSWLQPGPISAGNILILFMFHKK